MKEMNLKMKERDGRGGGKLQTLFLEAQWHLDEDAMSFKSGGMGQSDLEQREGL